jgi:adenylate cyclase
MLQTPTFVAREGELWRLNQYLEQILTGQGRVCFITGNAGSGKTALIGAFIHEAVSRHKKLVAAMGIADATTGAGDAYLPFREILSQLTGDVEAKFSGGVISQENTSRLRKLLGLSGEAIAELGPDLIGVFIPGGGLLARTAVFAANKAGWMEKLKKSSEKSSLNKKFSVPEISQSHIFEQYTNVLCRVAKKHPMVVILDDLHWADTATCELLFH